MINNFISKSRFFLAFYYGGNMKKEELKRNDNPMNLMALDCLLNYGRNNLLNDDYYNHLIKQMENDYEKGKGNPFMEKDYAIEIIRTSRKMASLEHKDLYDFIQKDLIVIQEIQQENDSPDYDY